jgi:hypothetical protein
MKQLHFLKKDFHAIIGVLAATLIVLGLQWDISWHESIGRDAFLSPPHIVIYLGGILGGAISGLIVLKTTFGQNLLEKQESVSFWGFKGSLGGWVCIWGAIAMLTSAPFDDWWHNAYGFDVEIISPPHTILAMGFFAIIIGVMLIILAKQNRSNIENQKYYSKLYVYSGSILLLMMMIFTMEKSFSNKMHSLEFYQVQAIAYPILLLAINRSSKMAWPATIATLICMSHRLIIIWVFPYFEAHPLLGPIYRPVDYFVAPPFPVLLILPAIVIDFISQKIKNNDWVLSLVIGVSFVSILLPFQWYFAEFLLSEGGQNRIFGEPFNKPYWVPIEDFNFKFWPHDISPTGRKIPLTQVTPIGILLVIFYAMVSTRFGLWWGSWLKRVKR